MPQGAKHKLRWLRVSVKCHCKCDVKNGTRSEKFTQSGYQAPGNVQPGPSAGGRPGNAQPALKNSGPANRRAKVPSFAARPHRGPAGAIFFCTDAPKPLQTGSRTRAPNISTDAEEDRTGPAYRVPVRNSPEFRPKGLGNRLLRSKRRLRRTLHPRDGP
jgi:hypothetical protein